MAPRSRRSAAGFTLVELLVALAMLALIAVLSWRGLDGMTRAREQTETRADAVLALQVGLAQWSADFDAIVQVPQQPAIDWDGRVLRLTRRSTTDASDGLLVVAWTRRGDAASGQWLRWQSPPVTQRAALAEAWQQAVLWAQSPGDAARQREVVISALQEWQIFYFRADAWTNPLSSAGTGPGGVPAGPPGMAPAPQASAIPEGVRLVLTLPDSQPPGGRLTRDWVRPTVSGGKS